MIASLAAALILISLPGSEPVSHSGSFADDTSPPVLARGEMTQGQIVGEWPGRRVAGGRSATGVFTAPSAIEFEIAGFPTQPNVRLFLEDATDPGKTVDLAIRRPSAFVWRTRRWQLPSVWVGRRVRLIVEDKATTPQKPWLAFTPPREARVVEPKRFVFALQTLLSLTLEFILLLLPGVALALGLGRKGDWEAPLILTAVLIGCGISALVTFACFLLGPVTGKLTCCAVFTASSGVIAIHRGSFMPAFRGAGIRVLFLWLMAAMLYISAAFLYRNDDVPSEQAQDRFLLYQLPPDNLLPLKLAEKIYLGQPFRPVYFGDIQSSDRPPLQAGFVLMQRSLWIYPELQYQLLGTLLQSAWIPALWVFLRRAKVHGVPLLVALAVPALSYFAYVHDIFVWPKLLAAAFGLLALSCFGWFGQHEATRRDAVLGGLSLGLAMLSHSNVAFTAIGFGILVAALRVARLRWAVQFAVVAAGLFLPWILYQKLYDPPGDALIKLHLSGVIDRQRSLGTLIIANYKALGVFGWLAAKWVNLKLLLGSDSGGGLAMRISAISFFSLFPSLGLANLGFLCRLRNAQPVADRMMAAGLASLAVWLLMMFAPGSTTVHQGPFPMVLLFYGSLSLYAAAYSPQAGAVLAALQLVQLVLFVVLAKPVMDRSGSAIPDTFPDVAMFLTFGVMLTLLTIAAVREWRRPTSFST